MNTEPDTQYKKELQQMIEESFNYPIVITSNESYAEMIQEWVPGIKIKIVPQSFLPDVNTCYVVPDITFSPIVPITNFYKEE